MKSKILVAAILLLVVFGVYLNQQQKQAVDRSKIPEKVENSKGFQRWVTNLKNKDLDVGADEFQLVDENEIYNTKWMKVYSLDEDGVEEEYNNRIAEMMDVDMVYYSPSERQYIDIRPEKRFGYKPNEANYYGLREDKLLDARLVDCSTDANCHFDRAYFLEDSNDVIVISEFSRNIDKKEMNPTPCAVNEVCTYSIKLHIIDLLRNSRLVYESEPFELNLEEKKKDF